MGKEIERKFLVKGEFRHLAAKKYNITQAYFSIDSQKVIRLRISEEGGLLTIKARAKEGSLERKEWNICIPAEDANEMLSLCIDARILKTRYIVPFAGHIFEVDEFLSPGKGLVVAEIELDSEDEPFEKPDWLGEEVTGKPEYYNSNMIVGTIS